MLAEQHAEAEQLYEARAARLQSLLEDWKSKYGALRRRFALETEGFRRDADEIGRWGATVGVGQKKEEAGKGTGAEVVHSSGEQSR